MYDYTKNDIEESLKMTGIQKGDEVFIHSNLGFFGKLENCTNKEYLCETFLTAIQNVIGENGTIIVPTFSYSFCKGELFEPQKTKSGCGMFAEYIRKQKDAVRSMEPNFSVASLGANNSYLEQIGHEAFGKNSFWEKWNDGNRGKILNLNFDCGSTFVHFIEHENDVPYRYNKSFNGEILLEDGKKKRDYYVHYVYDKEREIDAPNFSRLDQLCKTEKICKSAKLGKGNINVMNTNQYFEYISKILKVRPRFLTNVENE